MYELKSLLQQIVVAVSQNDVEGLSPADAARFIGVSTSKFHSLNSSGMLPSPVELGDRCPRWIRTELRAWLLAGSPSRIKWNSIRDAKLRAA